MAVNRHLIKILATAALAALLAACDGGSSSGGDSAALTPDDRGLTEPSSGGGDSTAPGTDGGDTTPDVVVKYPPAVVRGEPTLLYSDLEQGPVNTIVTVWGQNIQPDATLMCGSQECEVLSWGDDPHHPAHGRQPSRQKIVVRYTDSGGGAIRLVGANSLPFTVTDGQIHDMYPPGPVNLSSVQPGDVVYLHGGTYTSGSSVPGGDRAIIPPKSGIGVVGYYNENVVLSCSGQPAFDVGTLDPLADFTLANVEMDCGGSGRAIRASRAGSRDNLRIIGNYVHDARSSNSGAFGEFSITQDLFVLGNRIERTGVPGENNAHAIYHGGRGVNHNVNISYNTIQTHEGGRAIQIFGHREGEVMTQLIIRGNHVVDARGNAGILVSHSDGPSGVAPDDPSRGWIKDALIDDNTVELGNGAGVNIKSIGADVRIENNVLIDGSQSISVDFAKSVTIANNCMDRPPRLDADTPTTESNNHTNYPDCL